MHTQIHDTYTIIIFPPLSKSLRLNLFFFQINRNKNKWKFHLKDGIMNLNGRDFVFQRATGDAEW